MLPNTIRDAGFWTERWWHAGRSPSSLARRTQRPWFPARMSNLDSSDHRTLFHFETVHFKWALAHRTRCRWVMQCRLRAQRPRASNKGLRSCPLCTGISPVSLNLLMMLCTVDDKICKAFAIWRWGTLFLKYSTIFYALFHRLESLCPSLLLRDSACLRHPFYS